MKSKTTRRATNWRRYPSADCPMCGGAGRIAFKLWSACGQEEFEAQVMRGSCLCVLAPGRRPTIKTLEVERETLIERDIWIGRDEAFD